MTKYHFTLRSENRKTGRIPVTMTEKSSCPSACPLKNKGCYAEAFPLRLHWDKVEKTGIKIDDLCTKISSLPAGQLWRHNVAGDLPKDGRNNRKINWFAMGKLIQANEGRRGFTYTHHDTSLFHNRSIIQAANRRGFTVNLSGNNPAHADQLADLDIGPVVTLLPADQMENTTTPAGRKITICPAGGIKKTSCATCKLCAIANRKTIIGFPAHGFRKKAASALAEI